MSRRASAGDGDVASSAPGKVRADGLTYGRAAAVKHLRAVDERMDRLITLAGRFDVQPEGELDPYSYLLRTAGVSGNKARSLHDLARHTIDGALPDAADLATMTDLEIVDRFTVVRGIGPWTVHMVLMFRLGRPDVLPTGDFGVREGWRLVYGHEQQPTPTAFRAATTAWQPYRSVASWYMYRAVDLHREGRLDLVGA